MCPEKNRRSKTGKGGGVKGREEEGGVKYGGRIKPAASVAGFSLGSGITAAWIPDELGNTCDRARPHCHTVCFLRKTRSAIPHKHIETLPPNSCTNGEDAFDETWLPWTSLFSRISLFACESRSRSLSKTVPETGHNLAQYA